MSCCSGKCGCGSSCSCGSSCNGCGKYPDLETSSATTAVILFNNSMPKRNKYDEGMEGSFVAEGGQGGCNCGGNCKCDPCNC